MTTLAQMKEEIRVRVSKKLKDALEKKAAKIGLNLSAYVRMKLTKINDEK